MTTPTPRTVQALLLKFKLEEVLPLTDPLTVPLLRLMLATDDIRHLQKLLIAARAGNNGATEADQLIHNGEVGHLFRLLCGHLFEAGRAFQGAEMASEGRLDAAMVDGESGRAALELVRRAHGPDGQGVLKYTFLGPVRNTTAFHYQNQDFRRSFEKHSQAGHLEGRILLSEASGLGRFILMDHLALFVIADELDEDLGRFQQTYMQRIGEAIRLAGALVEVVDRLLGYLIKQRQGAILEQREDRVTIPVPLRRARDEAERERGDYDSQKSFPEGREH